MKQTELKRYARENRDKFNHTIVSELIEFLEIYNDEEVHCLYFESKSEMDEFIREVWGKK